jgi:hypothetical protein
MSTHTQGPWVNFNGQIRPANGKGRTAGYAPLVKIHGDKRTTNDEINAANARLIAAAPELLEALQTIVKQFTKIPSSLKDSHARMKAHAAIAKATGEL